MMNYTDRAELPQLKQAPSSLPSPPGERQAPSLWPWIPAFAGMTMDSKPD